MKWLRLKIPPVNASLNAVRRVVWFAGALTVLSAGVNGAEVPAVTQFHRQVQPLLKEFCYDCHADGEKKGEVSFDEFTTDDALLHPELWLKVLKNTRAGLMPPQKKTRLSVEDQQNLERWIKQAAFGIDPKNPDPGRVTVRRLNRVEYRNTIHDLMGIDFNAEVEFPPDDTGYGFDNIGDVLTLSPMLLEKYLAAAKSIVVQAVPLVGKVISEQIMPGNKFRADESIPAADIKGPIGTGTRPEVSAPMSYYQPAAVSGTFRTEKAGSYGVTLHLSVRGGFDYDPGRCHVVFKINGREVLEKELGWYDNKTFTFDFDQKWDAGDQRMILELKPLTPLEKKLNSVDMRITQVTVRGPKEKEHWTAPKNYNRFFTKQVPASAGDRRAYAAEILGSFATKAFRRPVDAGTTKRLAALAESVYIQPGKNFETGVAHAMVAVLASPRFLFRLEEPANPGSHLKPGRALKKQPPSNAEKFSLIDEYSLASRLSYFLWSTMPDKELLQLAGRGELRKNLPAQVKRMLADARSEKLMQNFPGQWLQTRDVEGISINARAILARDSGQERQLRKQRDEFRALQAQREGRPGSTNQLAVISTNGSNLLAATITDGSTNAAAQRPGPPNRRFNQPRFELDKDLRDAMRRETEMFFASIVHEDRPVTELIESDYTFLNEKLAKLYALTNLNVIGPEMRRVQLPSDSPRGGVLTHGSSLVVTSNPDRTSPVKRGLFILENFLGTPAPPPPPNIPALEAVDKDFGDHEPTLREALQLHREKPLCSSCHARMDPIGLAFENFNAMSMWRDKERNQTIDTAGKLITGETFSSVRELKRILANEHRVDFYRCLTEKLLTYAVGRGTEYYDVETIDQIVQRLQRENGRFSALLMGVIESAPFQKMRRQATDSASDDKKPSQKSEATGKVAANQVKP